MKFHEQSKCFKGSIPIERSKPLNRHWLIAKTTDIRPLSILVSILNLWGRGGDTLYNRAGNVQGCHVFSYWENNYSYKFSLREGVQVVRYRDLTTHVGWTAFSSNFYRLKACMPQYYCWTHCFCPICDQNHHQYSLHLPTSTGAENLPGTGGEFIREKFDPPGKWQCWMWLVHVVWCPCLVSFAVSMVNAAIASEDATSLLCALQLPYLRVSSVVDANAATYLKHLSNAQEYKMVSVP